MFVGNQAKALSVLGLVAPRLVDRAMEVLAYTSQQSHERPASPDHLNALFEPGRDPRERGSHEPALLRSGSLYVKATERPALTLGVFAGAGALARALLRRKSAETVAPPPEAGDMAQLAPAQPPLDDVVEVEVETEVVAVLVPA